MSPQARYDLPPELSVLMRGEMENVISQANLGKENEQIARLYYVDKVPQIDVASELYLGRSTVQRRLPGILDRMRKTSSKLYS